jgi:WD40 repeat protein
MWSAMFSPDGRLLVTADDHGARIWNAQTGTPLFELPHADSVYDAMFTPDGTRVATVGGDCVLKIWDTATGALIREVTRTQTDGHPTRYFLGAVSPDGKLLAAIDASGSSAYLWSVATGAMVVELATGSSEYRPSIAFSGDGQWFAVTGGGSVQVFDTGTWRRAVTLAGPSASSLSFDPSGPRLVTGDWQGEVSVWSIPSGERLHRLSNAGAASKHVAFSPDGQLVVSVSLDGTERVWNVKSAALQLMLKNHEGAALWAEFDRQSKLVVSAGVDGVVAISDVATGLLVAAYSGSQGPSITARFDPSSQHVVSASWDGTARIWTAPSQYLQWRSSPIDGQDCVTDASLNEDRRFLALSCVHRGTHIWDTARDTQVAELPSVTPVVSFEAAFPAVSDTGDRAAIPRGSTVVIYELPGGRALRTIRHPAAVTAVAFARTGHDLVSGSADGSLLITQDGADSLALPMLPSGVDVVGFAPGQRVVAASASGRFRVYDQARAEILAAIDLPNRARSFRMSADGRRMVVVATDVKPTPPLLLDLEHPRIVAPLEGHKNQVFSARFIRGDREILTAGGDGVARRWDSVTGHLLQSYLGSTASLFDAAIDPEGDIVVTAGSDGVLRFWDASSGAMIWTLKAHMSAINGVHFEGNDIVTRTLTGELARWTLSKPTPRSIIDELVRCLPFRFDNDTGRLVEQAPCNAPVHTGPV